MRVLIVEDEQHIATRLDERLGRLKPRIDTVIAGSRTSGIEALQSSEFDFIVCDLRLPPKMEVLTLTRHTASQCITRRGTSVLARLACFSLVLARVKAF